MLSLAACTNHILFINSCINGHLKCCYFLAAVKILLCTHWYKYVLKILHPSLLGGNSRIHLYSSILEMKLLNHKNSNCRMLNYTVNLCLIFEKLPYRFPQQLQCMSSDFSTSSPIFIVCFCNSSHPNRCDIYILIPSLKVYQSARQVSMPKGGQNVDIT